MYISAVSVIFRNNIAIRDYSKFYIRGKFCPFAR